MKTEFLGISRNHVFCINGVDLFKCKWKTSGECAVVISPKTQLTRTLSVYEAEKNDQILRFAAEEVHPDEWEFYKVL